MLKREGKTGEKLIEKLIGRGHGGFNVHAEKPHSPRRRGGQEALAQL
jgi:hypothetical protein